MRGSVLVIGGDVAGIRASAELVHQQFKVYLVENGPRIGGKIAQIDRLPPTNEHLSCAQIPFLQEISSNPSITILTSAEVESIEGRAGDFTAWVHCGRSESQPSQQNVQLAVGAVIVAMEIVEEASEVLSRLDLKRDRTGSHFVLTSRDGFFVCSSVEGIGDSVVQACAAAAHCAALLAPARGTELEPQEVQNLFRVKPSDPPRIALVLEQGPADVVDILSWERLAHHARTLPGVERVELVTSASEGSAIHEALAGGELNRLIVAGPSPITHEIVLQRLAETAGLNRYLLEIVNLHDQCARVHSANREEANEKAETLLEMSVARARRLEPLEDLEVGIAQRCLVVGGSPAGLACAATLADMDIEVDLAESHSELETVAGNDHPLVKPLLDRVVVDGNVEIHAPVTLEKVRGCLGDFHSALRQEDSRKEIHVGAIVIATSADIAVDSGFATSLALEKNEDGLFVSTQGILNLLDFTTDGVFNCGPARAALDTRKAILDGQAAASRAACVLSSPVLKQSPVVSNVVDANCDGCAYCVEPCPTRSITLLEFMQRDELKKIVEVNETSCIGCGICMATCPKQGIFLRHFRSETFLAMVRAALRPSRVTDGFQPVIVSFCCNRCAYPGVDSAAAREVQYPTSVRVIRSVCSGTIHPNVITDALTEGADGVLLCGCHPGDCRSREGIHKALARAASLELLLEDFGLEPERFRLEFIAASEGAKFARLVTEMTEELAELGPSPYRQDL